MIASISNQYTYRCTCGATGCPIACYAERTPPFGTSCYYNPPVVDDNKRNIKWKPYCTFIDIEPIIEYNQSATDLVSIPPKVVMRSMFSVKTVFSSKIRKAKKSR